MSNYVESRVTALRRDLVALQSKVAQESKKEAEARKRSSQEQARAAKASSVSSMASAKRQAERHEKDANDAVQRRARIELEIARKTEELYRRQTAVDKARTDVLRKLDRQTQSENQRRQSELLAGMASMASNASAEPERAYDFFISHSSVDKAAVVKPLYDEITALGCSVWLDEAEIKVGASIRVEIDRGLRNSRFGIVVLSRAFLGGSTWTQRELDGLFLTEETKKESRILPLWHDVTKEEVAEYSPMLAARAALKTADYTIREIAHLLHDRLALGDG